MLLITGALLAGCGELTVEAPRGTVTVKPGQEFVLENPSVGYDWRLDSQFGPGGPVGYFSYGTELEDPGADGGGVHKNFRFEGRRSGENVLRSTRLYREKPDRRRSVRIVVQ